MKRIPSYPINCKLYYTFNCHYITDVSAPITDVSYTIDYSTEYNSHANLEILIIIYRVK